MEWAAASWSTVKDSDPTGALSPTVTVAAEVLVEVAARAPHPLLVLT